MNRILGIGLAALACATLAACGGSSPPGRDAGVDTFVPPDDGGADEGIVAVDAFEAADHHREIPPTDHGTDDGVRTDDATVQPDVPEVPGPDADVPADGDQDADLVPDLPLDTCVGPACVPCEDDGLPCTDEQHDPETGECVSVLKPDFCLVDGACYFTLQPDPDDQCLFCVPAVATDAFSPSEGLPCDDGDLCTSGDTCDGRGKCVAGVPTNCDDSNDCTIDRCDPRVGCTYTNYDSSCDDHNACTYLDRCQNRKCVGTPIACSSTNECITASCDPAVGCLKVPNTKPCNDLNACTANDTCAVVDGVATCVGTRLDCDDGDPCTVDSCVDGPAGGCLHQAKAGIACDDGNACTVNDFCSRPDPLQPPVCTGYDRVCDDGSPCTLDSCDPATGCVFTPYVPEVNPCPAAADPCTTDEQCVDGKCQGGPKDCEDGNLCTIDSCDPLNGCQHVPTNGACDDHNPCTTGENCSSGVCSAPAGPVGRTDCDDHNDCTTDDCLPAVGCIHTPLSGNCIDPNPCSETGFGFCQNGECLSNLKDCNDFNPCTLDSCDAAGNCIHTMNIGGACDDGNACTVATTCDASGECKGGHPLDCNDNNVCTDDKCNVQLGCVYTPIEPTPNVCSDGSVCTINDQCVGGVCVGQPIVCEDDNYCTSNECDPATGCYYPPIERPCDDANVCTDDDQCVGGACVGISQFEDPSVKAGKLWIDRYGNPGDGVDVDDNVMTCAPKGSCVQGIDNSFGELFFLFTSSIVSANAAGTLALMLEAEDPMPDGTPFRLNMYWGERIAPASCDPTGPDCTYGVVHDDLQPVCEPVYSFPSATLNGTKLLAGGHDYQVPVYLVFSYYHMELTLHWAKIQGTATLKDGKVTAGAGALGGYLVLSDLIDGLNAVPATAFQPPYSRDILLQYITLLMKPDIDADGDGTKESVSIGFPFTLVTAHIIGPL